MTYKLELINTGQYHNIYSYNRQQNIFEARGDAGGGVQQDHYMENESC